MDEVQLIRCVFKEMDEIKVRSVLSQLSEICPYSTEVKCRHIIPNIENFVLHSAVHPAEYSYVLHACISKTICITQ